jgi:hypothetical protein
MGRDKQGGKHFDALTAELAAVADKLRAFDTAIAMENGNLREASRQLDVEADRQQALAAKDKWEEHRANLPRMQEGLRIASDAYMASYRTQLELRELGLLHPNLDKWRIATFAIWRVEMARPRSSHIRRTTSTARPR